MTSRDEKVLDVYHIMVISYLVS